MNEAETDEWQNPRLGPPLARSFYEKPVLEVARRMVGQWLVSDHGGERRIGRIVEVEAYGGLIDPASHSFKGPTPRCATMFGPVGHAYVYFIYGTHFCLNVIAGSRRWAGAILLRGVEPVVGLASMREQRALAAKPGPTHDRLSRGQLDSQLSNGPGKLAAAWSIDGDWDGHDLTVEGGLWLARGRASRSITWSPRIGLGNNPAAGWFWRCYDSTARDVSRVSRDWPTRESASPSLDEAAREYPALDRAARVKGR